MASIFVLGGSGYIGQALVKEFRQAGWCVYMVGRNASCDLDFDLAEPSFEFLDKLKAGDKFVFLSAVSSPEECAKNYAYAYSINVTATCALLKGLLEKCVDVLFASSDVVYGRTSFPVTENDKINPQFEYARMKAEVESRFLGDPHFKVMRLSYVWSLNDKFTSFLQQSFLEKNIVDVFHPFIRSVVSLRDVVDYVNLFAKTENGFPSLVNLAGPAFLSRLDIVKAFSEYRPLKYSVTSPDSTFFKFRPDQILMESSILESILCHKPRDVLEEIRNSLY